MDNLIYNSVNRRRNWILETVIALYVILKPFYFRASGSFQIADVFFVLATIHIIGGLDVRLVIPSGGIRAVKFFILLCIYQFAINSIWSVITGYNLMLPCVYSLYNLIVFIICLLIGEIIGAIRLVRTVVTGCIVSIPITVIGCFVITGRSFRPTGFFNNPNQLGYYALVILTVILMLDDTVPTIWKSFLSAVAFLLAVVSASRAAVVGMIVTVFAFFCMKTGKRSMLASRMLILAVSGLILYIVFFFKDSSAINSLLNSFRIRFNAIGTEKISEIRGYSRISEIGLNIIEGVGEGGYDRFLTRPGYEVHSTFLSLMVCYGIVGFTLYLFVLISCIIAKGRTGKNILIISGLVVFQLVHNGIRNPLVWLVFACMCVMNSEEIRNRGI